MSFLLSVPIGIFEPVPESNKIWLSNYQRLLGKPPAFRHGLYPRMSKLSEQNDLLAAQFRHTSGHVIGAIGTVTNFP